MSESGPVRVMVVPCETGPEAATYQAERLIELFPHSWDFQLTSDPAGADLILITDLREGGDDFRALRHHPLAKRFPGKTFTIDESPTPPCWLRGIHTAATKRTVSLGRIRAGGFGLTHPNYRNDFVETLAGRMESTSRDKRYLLSFVGRSTNSLREKILRHDYTRLDVCVREGDTTSRMTHDPFGRSSYQREYAEIVADSKFVICPRGRGVASVRWFDAMSLGVCPVILSDRWLPPEGPDWKSFALFVAESDYANIEAIVTQHESEWRERGEIARAVYQEYFSGQAYVKFLIRSALNIQASSVIPERLVQWAWWPALIFRKLSRQLGCASRRSDRGVGDSPAAHHAR